MESREEKALIVTILESTIQQIASVVQIVDREIRIRDSDTLHAISVDLDRILIEGPRLSKAMRAIIGRYERGL
jgi:hypothetical protein